MGRGRMYPDYCFIAKRREQEGFEKSSGLTLYLNCFPPRSNSSAEVNLSGGIHATEGAALLHVRGGK